MKKRMTATSELVSKVCQVLGGEHNRTQVAEALGLDESEDDARLAEISRITSVAEARQAYYNAPGGSRSEEAALAKWDELYLATVVSAATPAAGSCMSAAMAKWNKLSLAEVSAAKTVDQARQAYNNAPSGESQKAAIRKIAELLAARLLPEGGQAEDSSSSTSNQ